MMIMFVRLQRHDDFMDLPVPYEHLSPEELESGVLVNDGSSLLINGEDVPTTGFLREAMECVTVRDYLNLCNAWNRRAELIEVQKRREAVEKLKGG